MSETEPGMFKRMWREAPLLTVGVLLAVALTLFFSVRLLMGAIFWADPAHRDVPPAPWMTPRFVAHSWHLPPEVVSEALAFKREGKDGRITLGQLAAERDVPVEKLIDDLKAAIAAHREAHP